VDAETDGSGVPGFVVNEFRKFLRCGVLAHGFARVRCGDCAFERLVRFSLRGCVPRIAHGLTSLSILRGFRRYRIQPLQPDRGGGRSHYIPGDLSRAAPHRLSGPTRACRGGIDFAPRAGRGGGGARVRLRNVMTTSPGSRSYSQ
jgi:hypothetical protein